MLSCILHCAPLRFTIISHFQFSPPIVSLHLRIVSKHDMTSPGVSAETLHVRFYTLSCRLVANQYGSRSGVDLQRCASCHARCTSIFHLPHVSPRAAVFMTSIVRNVLRLIPFVPVLQVNNIFIPVVNLPHFVSLDLC